MTSISVGTAAATAVLNYDLMSSGAGSRHKTARHNRWITAFGLTGSTAVGDAAVDLYVGSKNYGTFINTTAGAAKFPTSNADMKPLRIPVPAGDPISLVVTDAPATEVLAFTLDLAP